MYSTKNNESLRILHNGKKNIIWGCGKNGKELLVRFINQGIYITGYCDSNVELQGLKFLNKQIFSPYELLNNKNKYNFIITPQNQVIIDEIIDEIGDYKDVVLIRDLAQIIYPKFNVTFYHRIIKESKKRKIYIWKRNREAEVLCNRLEYLDVEVSGFVICDSNRELREDEVSLFDLLMMKKDEYQILIPGVEEIKECEEIEKYGFCRPNDYNFSDTYVLYDDVSYILDPIFGYNFVGNKKMIGFDEYGDGRDLSIVILGGSTSDTRLYSFKSWPEFLLDELVGQGVEAKIFVGATTGYKSSQECLKLIRDVIHMKPDLVISYSGVNDAALGFELSDSDAFVHPYQQKCAEFIAKSMNGRSVFSWLNMESNANSHGIINDRKTIFENNIITMRDICNARNIKFLSILQPNLLTKKKNNNDKEIVLCEMEKPLIDCATKFYKEVNRKLFLDLTGLFREHDEVYIDWCHLNQDGNEIVAKEIANHILVETLNRG